jgi:hypothetical protein
VLLSDLERMGDKMNDTDIDSEMTGTSDKLIGYHRFQRSLLHSRLRKVHVPSACADFKPENAVELSNLMEAIGAQCSGLVSIQVEIYLETEKYLRKSNCDYLEDLFIKQLPQLSQLRSVILYGYAYLEDSDLEMFAKYTPRLE